MEQAINDIVSLLNNFLWNNIIIVLLIGAGVWFTLKTNFIQITQIPEMLRIIGEGIGESTKKNHISSFQAFCVSTASRVGVGNIAGVAIAIVLGGPGAVFWMWFIALLGSATGFIESTLAQIYKEPLKEGGFYGGPAYYIRYGLKSNVLSVLFAILISITFGLIYNSVQANTIAAAFTTFDVSVQMMGIIVSLLTAIVIFGGISRIAKVSEVLVPIMAGIYILVAIYVIISNITLFPTVISTIFEKAFDFSAAGGGFLGATMMNGIKRGLFSNEAGEGSVPNAAATADVTHPVKQGLVQAFGVFLDTLIICTASAFIVLMVGDYTETGKTGIELIQYNLALQLGSWAPALIAVFIFMFSFSSIVGNYYYGEINISHLANNKLYLHLFRIAVVGMVFIGAVASLDFVWNLADLFMAFLVVTNVSSILLLHGQVMIVLKDYLQQKKQGILEPVFYSRILTKRDGIVWWQDNWDKIDK